jgi:SAM-dependent methyltransferase
VIVKRFAGVFKAEGVLGVLRAVARRIRAPRAGSLVVARAVARNKIGIEIGGPSPIFASYGLLSVYPVAARVDNCNFARNTLWEGAITDGDSFLFHRGKAPGRQFIAEGADLSSLPGEAYDFVLSSHMLEHTANPLRALGGWRRLLKPGGTLILVVPHRDGTFDHRRPLTTLEHLVADFDAGTGEDDPTHMAEVLTLHDVSRDPGVTDIAMFRERIAQNSNVRSMHHHVFDTSLAARCVVRAGFDLVSVEPLEPYHVVVLARKALVAGRATSMPDEALRRVLAVSPFETDRKGA